MTALRTDPVRSGQAGSILALALIMLAVISSVTLLLVDRVGDVTVEATQLAGEYEAGFAADGGLLTALRLLSQDRETYADTPLEPWAVPYAEDGLRLRIRPAESGLNLNVLRGNGPEADRARQAVLELLEAREALQRASTNGTGDIPPARQVLGSMLYWLGAEYPGLDRNGEEAFYSLSGCGYHPRQGLISRPEELLLCRGFTPGNPDDRDFLTRYFTVWGNGQALNINFAPLDLLAAYTPELKSSLAAIRAVRESRGFTDISQLLKVAGLSPANYAKVVPFLTVRATALEVTVEARARGWYEKRRYIVQRSGNAGGGFQVLARDVLESRPD